MTGKENIIDGVNVSGCCKQGETMYGITCGLPERIRFGNKYIYKHTLCKDNPNCNFKQLQRKTAECKRYEQALNEIGQEIHGLGSLITILDIIDKAKDDNNEMPETKS